MQYWNIKEVADTLGITYQAIYKNRENYIKLGYMEKIDNQYKLNIQGYNYLLERKKKVEPRTPEPEEGSNIKDDYIELLKDRVKQLENELKEVKQTYTTEINTERERTAYFKALFEQKDRQLNVYLLPGKTEPTEPEKNNFFSRLFNRH